MKYNRLDPSWIPELEEIVGQEHILREEDHLRFYSRDETEDLSFLPELVVRPGSSEEIATLVRWCAQRKVPLTPRGAGTGLSGSALPVHGGLLLSMERMNRILEIDEANLQARVEAGVITETLMKAAEAKGLLYPIDPSSKGSCFIGGNIAHGSGGPRVVKYGSIRDYVLNLEVVLPSGEIIWTGANTLKNATGYSLTQLFIGSEGTLGIITKAVLKLLPRPAHTAVMMAEFPSNEQACAAVSAVFRAGFVPSALEFMEREGVEWVCRYEPVNFELREDVEAYLLIELDGNDPTLIAAQCEQVAGVLYGMGCMELLLADTGREKEELWRIRHLLPHSVKANSVYKEEDTVVPRAALPQLIRGIKEIGRKYGFQSVCYGHAGDGNLHVNIIRAGMSPEDWKSKLKEGIKEIFRLTVSLGGTLSGEHGIGYVQREFLDIAFSAPQLALLRSIKDLFDPGHILNPGKIFPD